MQREGGPEGERGSDAAMALFSKVNRVLATLSFSALPNLEANFIPADAADAAAAPLANKRASERRMTRGAHI